MVVAVQHRSIQDDFFNILANGVSTTWPPCNFIGLAWRSRRGARAAHRRRSLRRNSDIVIRIRRNNRHQTGKEQQETKSWGPIEKGHSSRYGSAMKALAGPKAEPISPLLYAIGHRASYQKSDTRERIDFSAHSLF